MDSKVEGPYPSIPGLEIVAEIGRGAHAVVYTARRDEQLYAVKMPRMAPGSTDDTLMRFRREAAALARIRHPALPTVLEVGEVDSFPYLVLERAANGTLADLLAHGPLSESRVVEIGTALAGALGELHRFGLVHRDVKPSNVVLDGTGRVMLVDLGLAVPSPTAVGDEIAGTLRYAAPEQTGLLKRPVDARSDLYALGVLLFECATGAPPFVSTDAADLAYQHAARPAPDVRERNPAVSPALAAVIAKLLAKDPDDRYQSAAGLLADLAALPALNAALAAGAEAPLGTEDHHAQPLVPLIGRDRELDRLRRLLTAAAEGTGSAVLITGVAGSGKTRLVAELQHLAAAGGALVLRGRCTEANPVPFAPLREAIEEHVRSLRRLPPDRRMAAEGRLKEAARPAARVVAGLSPVLAALLGVEPEGSSEPVEDHFSAALATFLRDLAQGSGHAVMIVEDIHWLDKASRQVLRRLTDRVEHAPLLVVLTAREGMQGETSKAASGFGASRVARIRLSPLDERAVAELIAAHLGGHQVEADVVERVVTLSGGLPYAVEEYVRAMLETGVLRPSWGTWLVDRARLASLSLPADIARLLSERIDGLSPATRALLDAAAVLGTSFRLGEAEAMAQLTPPEAIAALDAALAAHVVEHDEGDTYRFTHDRVREALLARLADAERRSLHQRAAETLAQAGVTETGIYRLARHYAEGDPLRSPVPAYEANLAAGIRALEHFAYNEAYDFLDTARRIARDAGLPPDERLDRALGDVCSRTGRVDEATTHLESALKLCTDATGRAQLRARLARIQIWELEIERAAQEIEAAFAEIGETLEARAGRMARAIGAWAGFVLDDRLGGAIPPPPGDPARLRVLVALYHLAIEAAMLEGRPQSTVLQNLLLSLGAARALGPSRELIQANVDYGMLLATMRRVEAMQSYFRKAIDLAHARDDRPMLAYALLYEAIAHHIAGRPREAETLATRCLEQHADWLAPAEYLNGSGDLIWNLVLRGYIREARRWIEEAIARTGGRITNQGGAHRVQRYMDAYALAVLEVLGEAALAREYARRAEALVNDHPRDRFAWEIYLSHRLLALVERGGSDAEIEEVIARGEELDFRSGRGLPHFRRFFVFQGHARLLQVERAPANRRAAALRRLNEAIEFLERIADHPTLRAHTWVLAAARARLEGRHHAALELLDRADRLATEIDAPWVLFEATRQRALVLAALGNQPGAERAARYAHALATEHGWVHRAARVRADFPAATAREPALEPAVEPSSRRLQQHLDALLQVSLATATALDPEQQSRAALDEAVRILGAERAFLFRIDGPDLRLVAGRDASGNPVTEPRDFSRTVVETVRATGQPMIVSASSDGPVLGSESIVAYDLRSIIAAPLTLRERTFGVLYLDNRLARGVFTPADLDILRAIAGSIAIALETARLAQIEAQFESERQQRLLAERLRDLTGTLTATLDLSQVLDRLLTSLAAVVPYDTAAVVLHHADRLELAMVRGTTRPDEAPGLVIPLANDILLAEVVATGQPLVIADTRDDPRCAHRGGMPDLRAWLGVPLISESRVAGVVVLTSQISGAFGEREAGIAFTFAGQAGVAIENARLFAEVQRLAVTDDLTGTHNRRHLLATAERELSRAQRFNRPLAAIILDIDEFKRVNDAHGHSVGDEVLRAVANRLRNGLREVDILGRYGGEEFVIILPETDLLSAYEVAERLRSKIAAEPIATSAGPVSVTISLGVAAADPTTPDFASLLSRIDDLLYTAKRRGRNRVVVG